MSSFHRHHQSSAHSALTSVVDAERARRLAIGERRQQVRQPGVGAMRGDEPLDAIAPVPATPGAHDRERRLANVRGSSSRRGAWVMS